jgi:hypothetical protein
MTRLGIAIETVCAFVVLVILASPRTWNSEP